MRLLGVDLGAARIGIATGETEAQIAIGRKTLQASGTLQKDAEAVLLVAMAEEAEAIVVGVPSQHGEEESRQTQICERFAEILRELGAVVFTVDESLSSKEAESMLQESGRKAAARRKVRDAESARIILERFFSDHG